MNSTFRVYIHTSQPLGIVDVMSCIPCEPSILTVNRPQIPHLLNQLQMAHSSTFTEQVDSPTLQELRSSQSGRYKTLCGWHARIPAPSSAVSRWHMGTYESDEDGKSHSKQVAGLGAVLCPHSLPSSENKWFNCLLVSSLKLRTLSLGESLSLPFIFLEKKKASSAQSQNWC